MNQIFFTVGPSQLYPTVSGHIKTALKENFFSLSHRSKQFSEIYKETTDNLRKLLSIPTTHHIFFTSCALEAMERTIQNTVEKKSFHFINGTFSRAFWQIAKGLKKDTQKIEVENGKGFNFSSVTIPKDTEAICIVQNETSTGVAIPMEEVYKLKKKNPKSLIILDVVSSVPYIKIDFAQVDVVLFSVQKGFGLPAGLGVVIVNEKALKKTTILNKKNINIGSYHNFLMLSEFEKKFQTPETPNVSNIYLLGKIAKDMSTIGIETIRKQTETKAKLLYTYFENHKKYKPFVADALRSKTTIVIDVTNESQQLREKLAEKGYIIASGYGKAKDSQIRIANFPALSVTDTRKMLQCIP